MMRENGVGRNGTEPPGGECERIKGQHFTTLLKTTKKSRRLGGLNQLVQRNAGGAQWTWKKVAVVVDSGAVENVMPKNMFTEIATEETERSKNGQGMKGPEEEHIKKLRTAGHVCQNS